MAHAAATPRPDLESLTVMRLKAAQDAWVARWDDMPCSEYKGERGTWLRQIKKDPILTSAHRPLHILLTGLRTP